MASPVFGMKIEKLPYDLRVIPIVQLDKKTLDGLLPLTLISFQAGDIVSKLIGLATVFDSGNDDFSHSGVIVDETIMPWLAPILKGRKAIWESTNSKTFGGVVDSGPTDVVTGVGRLGSQIRLLGEVVDQYLFKKDGSRSKLVRDEQLTADEVRRGRSYICISNVKNNPVVRTSEDTDESYKKRMKGVVNRMELLYCMLGTAKYEINLAMLASTVVPQVRPAGLLIGKVMKKYPENEDLINQLGGEKGGDIQFQFCSELVFRIYQFMGLAPHHISASSVTPVEFFGSKSQKLSTLVDSIAYLVPPEVKKEYFRRRIWKLKGTPPRNIKEQVRKMDQQ